ncbi:MAG TPA: HlyD family efflux transporter periplasmic adaptor subunit [Rhodanobacteraceae bacterium]
MNARIRQRFACAAMFCLLVSLLTACGRHADQPAISERVQAGPLLIAVQAEGELHAIKSTSLVVPGQQFSNRQLAWTLPDGSPVKKGELVARFSADRSKQDLDDALIDLQRNALTRAGKQSDLDDSQGKLEVTLAETDTQLDIAHRYAHATILAVARDKILDSVQDEHFLTRKEQITQWRLQQSGTRGAAELAVIDAQHATYALKAKQKRDDLGALEVRASHDGVLVLQDDWSGVKPSVGGTMWGGQNFASIPDTSSMEVELQVPELQAQGIAAGDAVVLHPAGAPDQQVSATLSWVADAALPKSRESPVKYISMKAGVPAAAALRYGWTPGQHFVARVILLDAKSALSVPNLAIANGTSGPFVRLSEGGKVIERMVTLGVRGAARAQVLRGLQPGDEVLLNLGGGDGGP